jgi:hypothetical protein
MVKSKDIKFDFYTFFKKLILMFGGSENKTKRWLNDSEKVRIELLLSAERRWMWFLHLL